MTADTFDELDNTDGEAPGGTQVTHSAARKRGPRVRVADRVDRVGDSLERHALELELKGGMKSKAAPVVRRARQVADAGAEYVRANNIMEMRGDLEREISEHPLKSIAIALGCGYLLSKLLD